LESGSKTTALKSSRGLTCGLIRAHLGGNSSLLLHEVAHFWRCFIVERGCCCAKTGEGPHTELVKLTYFSSSLAVHQNTVKNHFKRFIACSLVSFPSVFLV